MYTLQTISEDLNRELSEVEQAIEVLKLEFKEVYSEYEYTLIHNFFSIRKPHLMEAVRYLIKIYPFSLEREIAQKLNRPTSYARWILTELSYEDGDLAETDNDELFYVNDSTLEMLKEKLELT